MKIKQVRMYEKVRIGLSERVKEQEMGGERFKGSK